VRIASVDIGSNSTRLLIADIQDGAVRELEKRSVVTRLADGVDGSGRLADAAVERVCATLGEYRRAIDEHEAVKTIAVLTSAVRDAENGAAFAHRVRSDYGLDARTLGGDEEARMTYLGAISERAGDGRTRLVIDIGGGSTELVVGRGEEILFHTSTQAGVVRQTERHVHHDPPMPDELQSMAEEVRAIYTAAVPGETRTTVEHGIAVAGTATSCAAMSQQLEPYDAERVEGYELTLGEVEMLLAKTSSLDIGARRHLPGLHPDRAPTIIAGTVLLAEALRVFGLAGTEVTEHDILRGAALVCAGVPLDITRQAQPGL
jgi:exopolyphosphatase/guanosine-5'-triphosphate,3'-diphosphate pyrophosphatase